ncbi:hypothetical protein OEZ86_011692 [Tetradesmus obliquus]|nr:hypothetical protein OEZ86_011692 [Tetradesmus obliquus]
MAPNDNVLASVSKAIRENISKLPKGKYNKFVRSVMAALEKVAGKSVSFFMKAKRAANRFIVKSVGAKFLGSITITAMVVDIDEGRQPKVKTHERSFLLEWPGSNAYPTQEEIDDAVEKHIEHLRSDYYIKQINEIKSRREVNIHELVATGGMLKRAARDFQAIPISGMSEYSDRGEGKCVIDALRFIYGKVENVKKLMSQDTYIAAAMLGLIDAGQACTYDFLNAIVSINRDIIDEALQAGFTTEHIMAFAETIGIHAVSLDEDAKTIAQHSPKASHRLPPFVFHVRNNHLYPNLNPTVYNSVVRRGHNIIHKIKTAAPASVPTKKESSLEITVIPVEDEHMSSKDVWARILEMADDRGRLPEVTLSPNGVPAAARFFNDDTRKSVTDLLINQDYKVAQLLASRLGIKEPVRSIFGLYHHLAKKHLKDLPVSRPNPALDAWFRQHNSRHDAHVGMLEDWPSMTAMLKDFQRGNSACFDIKRAQPYVMYNPTEEWIGYDHNAPTVPYDGTPIDELENFFYITETENRTILNGNGIYDRKRLQYAKQQEVDFEIKAMAIPSSLAPKDLFHKYQHAVVAACCPDDLPDGITKLEMQAAMKRLLVMAIGNLGKVAEKKFTKIHLSENKHDAWDYINAKLQTGGYDRPKYHVLHHGDRTFYAYGMVEVQELAEHNAAMYLQILNMSAVHTHKAYESIGGILKGLKVDSFIVRNPVNRPSADLNEQADLIDRSTVPDVSNDPAVNTFTREELRHWGKVKTEEVPFNAGDLHDCAMDLTSFDFLPKAWVDHLNIFDSSDAAEKILTLDNHRALIIGPAGFGKTYVAKMICQHYSGPQYPGGPIMLAPTHAASNNLEGVTIHRFVGANIYTQTVGRKNLTKYLRQASALIVDEVTMCGEYLWFCLNITNQIRPDMPVYLFGGPGQLSPVESTKHAGYDYMEHPTLKALAGNNRITLTVNHRTNDPRLQDLNARLLDKQSPVSPAAAMVKSLPTYDAAEDVQMHIAMTNAMVFHINDMCMRKYKSADAVEVPADCEDSRTQKVWLHVGMPVYSCVTLNKKGGKGDKETAEHLKTLTVIQQLRAKVEIQNNEFHVITSVDVGKGTFSTQSKRTDLEKTWQITDFHRYFRPAYCFTVHKVQGLTLTMKFVIWEAQHMTREHAYTAVSRARTIDQISLGETPVDFFTAAYEHVKKNLQVMINHYRAGDIAASWEPCDWTVGLVRTQGEICPHCGEQMKMRNFFKSGGTPDPLMVTLDRIDNTTGHTMVNTFGAHLKCNISRNGNQDKHIQAENPDKQAFLVWFEQPIAEAQEADCAEPEPAAIAKANKQSRQDRRMRKEGLPEPPVEKERATVAKHIVDMLKVGQLAVLDVEGVDEDGNVLTFTKDGKTGYVYAGIVTQVNSKRLYMQLFERATASSSDLAQKKLKLSETRYAIDNKSNADALLYAGDPPRIRSGIRSDKTTSLPAAVVKHVQEEYVFS